MSARAKKVREEALALPSATRAKLAHDLLLSLEKEPFDPPEEVEKAWAAEIEARVRDVKEGRAKLIPAEQVFSEARERSKRARSR